MKLKIAVFGGMGAYLAYWAGWLSRNEKSFDLYYATSGGSIAALFHAIGKTDLLIKVLKTLTNRKMYDGRPPMNRRGNISKLFALQGIKDITKGACEFSDISEAIRELLHENYTEEDHRNLQQGSKEVIVTAQCVSLDNKPVDYFSSRDYDRATFVEMVVASAAIPLLSKRVEIGGKLYQDGGIAEGLPTRWIDRGDDVTVLISQKRTYAEDDINETFVSYLANLVGIMRRDIHHNDLERVEGMELHYLPDELSSSMVDFSKKNIKKLLNTK